MPTAALPLTGGQSALTVSQLNRQARLLLEERLGRVSVRGEVSNFRRPASGHWYFVLKDEHAQVRCVMFANRNRFIHARPGDGDEVMVHGRISLYEGRGDYQILAEHLAPAGEGALRAAFEALKQRLAAEGLFSAERKRPMPRFPMHLAVVSSPSGAALQDVLSVIRRRFPCLRITLVPAAVQGADAERQILNALQRAEALAPDALLLTRGGGSLEDLFAFNSEAVARAIADFSAPTVAATGHETDITIAELAADLRGATPSAAAELLTPDGEALAGQLAELQGRLLQACSARIQIAGHALAATRSRLTDPRDRIRHLMQRADELDERLAHAIFRQLERLDARLDGMRRTIRAQGLGQRIERRRQSLADLQDRARRCLRGQLSAGRERTVALARTLHAASPLNALARGFAIATGPDGRPLAQASQLQAGDAFHANFSDGAVRALAQGHEPLPERLRPLAAPEGGS